MSTPTDLEVLTEEEREALDARAPWALRMIGRQAAALADIACEALRALRGR